MCRQESRKRSLTEYKSIIDLMIIRNSRKILMMGIEVLAHREREREGYYSIILKLEIDWKHIFQRDDKLGPFCNMKCRINHSFHK